MPGCWWFAEGRFFFDLVDAERALLAAAAAPYLVVFLFGAGSAIAIPDETRDPAETCFHLPNEPGNKSHQLLRIIRRSLLFQNRLFTCVVNPLKLGTAIADLVRSDGCWRVLSWSWSDHWTYSQRVLFRSHIGLITACQLLLTLKLLVVCRRVSTWVSTAEIDGSVSSKMADENLRRTMMKLVLMTVMVMTMITTGHRRNSAPARRGKNRGGGGGRRRLVWTPGRVIGFQSEPRFLGGALSIS